MTIPARLRRFLLLTSIFVVPSLVPSLVSAQAASSAPAKPAEAPAAGDEPEKEVEVVVVRGRFIPEPQRVTSEVANFLSAADLARTGDDNAAAALTRLTGLSVVSGRFVYVRGLGDRYSSALLNGSPLPSPEPLRRQVPLDLFPSNILNGATVQKTFSPNYPGEFGGGVIDLRTLKSPNENFLTVKTGVGFNSETTGKTGLVYEGHRMDWTGLDTDLRRLPQPVRDAVSTGKRINDTNFTPKQLEIIGESFINSPLTVVQSEKTRPDFDAEMTAGRTFDVNEATVGLVGVLGYKSGFKTQEAFRQDVVSNTVEAEGNNLSSTWDIVINGFGSASAKWGDNRVGVTGLLVRSTSKKAQVEVGTDTNLPTGQSYRTEGTAWYERELASAQLSGEHKLGGVELQWRGSIGQSTRKAPYERDISYTVVNGITAFNGASLGNAIRFSELKDEVSSFGFNAKYVLKLAKGREVELSGGAVTSNTDRNYELISFAFTGPRGPTSNDVLRSRVDYLFSPDNINPARFVITEQTGKDDAYVGSLENLAAYLASEFEVTSFIRASVGVRYEDATQKVRTTNRFGDTPTAPVELANDYLLPAATVTWNFADELQMRLGYSKTIARPQFRELAFTPYIDPESNRIYQGNPFLKDSEFENYDARLEYYFGRGQFVTAGAFYKKIDNPIEEVIVRLERSFTRFINAPEATLYGLELEYRANFELPFKLPVLQDAKWNFAANYTYTHSEVNAPAGTNVISPIDFRSISASQFGLDGSELQGTPKNIANLQLGYETDNQQLTLLVGWVDERIARRGLGSVPSVIENPGTNVDLVFKQDFKVGNVDYTFGISGRNLLAEDNQEFQLSNLGRTEANTYKRGRSISLSLTVRN
ncbi:MAG: TonB-dependent receptor [Alphaproteobacteria bacterium PA3]|nr:MAG: TonB-dependent receptor [Alphaproteobacteria bacterium PA3]